MEKKDISYRVTKTGLNGEISAIKDGEIIKTIPAVLFNEAQAEGLLEIADYCQRNSYRPQ